MLRVLHRTMTQCMSLHASELAFLNRGGGFSLTGGGWEILLWKPEEK